MRFDWGVSLILCCILSYSAAVSREVIACVQYLVPLQENSNSIFPSAPTPLFPFLTLRVDTLLRDVTYGSCISTMLTSEDSQLEILDRFHVMTRLRNRDFNVAGNKVVIFKVGISVETTIHDVELLPGDMLYIAPPTSILQNRDSQIKSKFDGISVEDPSFTQIVKLNANTEGFVQEIMLQNQNMFLGPAYALGLPGLGTPFHFFVFNMSPWTFHDCGARSVCFWDESAATSIIVSSKGVLSGIVPSTSAYRSCLLMYSSTDLQFIGEDIIRDTVRLPNISFGCKEGWNSTETRLTFRIKRKIPAIDQSGDTSAKRRVIFDSFSEPMVVDFVDLNERGSEWLFGKQLLRSYFLLALAVAIFFYLVLAMCGWQFFICSRQCFTSTMAKIKRKILRKNVHILPEDAFKKYNEEGNELNEERESFLERQTQIELLRIDRECSNLLSNYHQNRFSNSRRSELNTFPMDYHRNHISHLFSQFEYGSENKFSQLKNEKSIKKKTRKKEENQREFNSLVGEAGNFENGGWRRDTVYSNERRDSHGSVENSALLEVSLQASVNASIRNSLHSPTRKSNSDTHPHQLQQSVSNSLLQSPNAFNQSLSFTQYDLNYNPNNHSSDPTQDLRHSRGGPFLNRFDSSTHRGSPSSNGGTTYSSSSSSTHHRVYKASPASLPLPCPARLPPTSKHNTQHARLTKPEARSSTNKQAVYDLTKNNHLFLIVEEQAPASAEATHHHHHPRRSLSSAADDDNSKQMVLGDSSAMSRRDGLSVASSPPTARPQPNRKTFFNQRKSNPAISKAGGEQGQEYRLHAVKGCAPSVDCTQQDGGEGSLVIEIHEEEDELIRHAHDAAGADPLQPGRNWIKKILPSFNSQNDEQNHNNSKIKNARDLSSQLPSLKSNTLLSQFQNLQQPVANLSMAQADSFRGSQNHVDASSNPSVTFSSSPRASSSATSSAAAVLSAAVTDVHSAFSSPVVVAVPLRFSSSSNLKRPPHHLPLNVVDTNDQRKSNVIQQSVFPQKQT